jgi:hypothetical protein
MTKPSMKWWKPIETGGSLSCRDCPQSVANRPEVADLEGTVRALEEEVAKWRKVADRLAEDGYFHSSAGIEAKNLYDAATGWRL